MPAVYITACKLYFCTFFFSSGKKVRGRQGQERRLEGWLGQLSTRHTSLRLDQSTEQVPGQNNTFRSRLVHMSWGEEAVYNAAYETLTASWQTHGTLQGERFQRALFTGEPSAEL